MTSPNPLRRFVGAFGATADDPRYLDYLDYDGNDRIGVIDLLAFLDRLSRVPR